MCVTNKGNCKLVPNRTSYLGDIISRINADVICLQEYSQGVAQQLAPYKLEDSYIFITHPVSQGWSGQVT